MKHRVFHAADVLVNRHPVAEFRVTHTQLGFQINLALFKTVTDEIP